MLNELNKWLSNWEPTWLFIVLSLETVVSFISVGMLRQRLSQRKYPAKKKKAEEFECLTIDEHK